MARMMQEPKSYRPSLEVQRMIYHLIKKYPDNYKTTSDVLRAGVFALERWRREK